MGYTNILLVSQILELKLFDDIPFKYIKNIIKNDDDEIDVEIKHLNCHRGVTWCKARFIFKLRYELCGHVMTYEDKKFVVDKEYNGSSAFALMMCNLYNDEEEEEEE